MSEPIYYVEALEDLNHADYFPNGEIIYKPITFKKGERFSLPGELLNDWNWKDKVRIIR